MKGRSRRKEETDRWAEKKGLTIGEGRRYSCMKKRMKVFGERS